MRNVVIGLEMRKLLLFNFSLFFFFEINGGCITFAPKIFAKLLTLGKMSKLFCTRLIATL